MSTQTPPQRSALFDLARHSVVITGLRKQMRPHVRARDRALVRALAAGCDPAAVAHAAQVSRQRMQQIVRKARTTTDTDQED